MRKQIGLRMKDETRDQLERIRGGLSRTDYIEGAVLAQIARDLKKTDQYPLDVTEPQDCKGDIIEDGPGGPMYIWICDLCGQPLNPWEKCNSGIHVGPNGSGRHGIPVKSTILAALLRQSKEDTDISVDIIENDRMPANMVIAVPTGEVFVGGEKVQNILQDDGADDLRRSIVEEYHAHKTTDIPTQTILSPGRVRSSAESKAGVLPVPKKPLKGRR